MLKEDPLLGIDYLKIINLIKRKKLEEATSDRFNPADAIDSTYLDVEEVERERLAFQKRQEEKVKRNMSLDDASSSAGDRLQLEDQESDTSVRATKKREEREKQRLLKQFDALSSQYEKSTQLIKTQEVKESAGDLKRKSKKKKEKTLSSKLRLKEKKGGGAEKGKK